LPRWSSSLFQQFKSVVIGPSFRGDDTGNYFRISP
jgi:hypothetical protein